MKRDVLPEITALLVAHQLDPRPGITPGGNPVCLCGWSGLGHLHHLADMLAACIAERMNVAHILGFEAGHARAMRHVQTARSEALREAADHANSSDFPLGDGDWLDGACDVIELLYAIASNADPKADES